MNILTSGAEHKNWKEVTSLFSIVHQLCKQLNSTKEEYEKVTNWILKLCQEQEIGKYFLEIRCDFGMDCPFTTCEKSGRTGVCILQKRPCGLFCLVTRFIFRMYNNVYLQFLHFIHVTKNLKRRLKTK